MERSVQDAIHEALRELCATRDFDQLTALARHAARSLTGADGVTFVLRQGPFCYYADEDAIAPLWKGRRFPLETCISGWVMTHGVPVTIPDVYEDARIPHEAYRPTFVRSMVMVPVQKVAPIAALGAYWQAPQTASAAHVQILELLAEAVAVSLTTQRSRTP